MDHSSRTLLICSTFDLAQFEEFLSAWRICVDTNIKTGFQHYHGSVSLLHSRSLQEACQWDRELSNSYPERALNDLSMIAMCEGSTVVDGGDFQRSVVQSRV